MVWMDNKQSCKHIDAYNEWIVNIVYSKCLTIEPTAYIHSRPLKNAYKAIIVQFKLYEH